MALSYTEVTATGSEQLLPVPEYIEQAHIRVSIDGVDTTDFSWVNSNTVAVTAPPGSLIRVYRDTSITERLVDFTDGVSLTEQVLDADSLQAFFLIQELRDKMNLDLAQGEADLEQVSALAAQVADDAAAAAASASQAADFVAELGDLNATLAQIHDDSLAAEQARTDAQAARDEAQAALAAVLAEQVEPFDTSAGPTWTLPVAARVVTKVFVDGVFFRLNNFTLGSTPEGLTTVTANFDLTGWDLVDICFIPAVPTP